MNNSNVTCLSSKKNSCVIKCSCCDGYQVSFKNIIINLKKWQLDKFSENVFNDNLLYTESPTYNNKIAMLKCSAETDFYIALNEPEINELKELLLEAYCTEKNYDNININ